MNQMYIDTLVALICDRQNEMTAKNVGSYKDEYYIMLEMIKVALKKLPVEK